MQKIFFTILFSVVLSALSAKGSESEELTTIPVFEDAVFYDGYRLDDNPDKDLQDGVLRHSCSLYAMKLTEEQLQSIGNKLDMNVFVTACCDNYDRIGNINLAFVPKGAESYSTDEVDRIEIGRFITPFMDKNKDPKTVPYSYNMDYLSLILRDEELRNEYDIWLELEIFGIPYAANVQIQGCEDRSDVFAGSLNFVTDKPSEKSKGNVLVPIVIKKPEYIGNNLNNYNENATDTIGKTTKTYKFEVPQDVNDAQIVLITSNHGANTNGEEYNRRWHYVYYDDELVMSYIPGRDTCEPFREYNTQSNGIYGYAQKSNKIWQSFSNWCPGDVIDNRIIQLGAVDKGEHKIRISVPDAKFAGEQGDIPVSMYFHGVKEGYLPAGLDFPVIEQSDLKIKVENNFVKFSCSLEIYNVEVYSLQGEKIFSQDDDTPIPTSKLRKEVLLFNVELENRVVETHKLYVR